MLENLLSPAAIENMRTFFRDQPVMNADGHRVPLEKLPPGTGMAAYSLDTVVACPGLMEAINGADILRIASDYLGCEPTLSSLGVRWSFPSAKSQAGVQYFHRDQDDWLFLKLFVYLTDVDAGCGPHLYVAGSHETAASARSRPHARAALESEYGTENIRMVTGARGTTFMADTHGIHAGMPPSHGPRLILQAQYSILPVFAFQYEPVSPPAGLALDPYVNRLLVR